MRKLFLLVPAALLLAGCGGGGKSATSAEVGTTVSNVRVLKTIVIHETEYRLRPRTIRIGRIAYYGIKAVNDGTVTHALVLEGHGLKKATGDIAPGESKTFSAFLHTPGTYELYCPIDGHKGKGMTAKLVVP